MRCRWRVSDCLVYVDGYCTDGKCHDVGHHVCRHYVLVIWAKMLVDSVCIAVTAAGTVEHYSEWLTCIASDSGRGEGCRWVLSSWSCLCVVHSGADGSVPVTGCRGWCCNSSCRDSVESDCPKSLTLADSAARYDAT